MQRTLPSGIAAALSILSIIALTVTPACKSDDVAVKNDTAAKQPEQKSEGQEAPEVAKEKDSATDSAVASSGATAGEAGAAEAGAAAGEAGAAEAGTAEAGAAEAGAAEAGTAESEDVVPGLFEQAKQLDTDDAAAKKALVDAIAAGASKIDAAKIANERGESLMADGESERAAAFFTWAADTHKLYSEPVYNLATLAAYAGDLEIAKERLQELQKRGNKKLMKKVGVDPAFALLIDDPEVRKIYEQ